MKKDVQLIWKKLPLVMFVIMVGTLSGAHASGGDFESVNELQDQITVTGTVIDPDSNEGLPGVTVLEKGTTNGTISDVEGNYKISVDPQSTLVFSFVGYSSKELAVNRRSVIDVTMEPDVQSLEEVVVIGYGEVKRADVTGSVVSMDSKQIEKTNKVDAISSLQGQVPGVVIQRTNNKPGSGNFNIRIRGASTINSNETAERAGFNPGQNPLFIVDGIFVSDISFLNPADIDRMDVLKDASATAIYGSRGSNGVVIIKTKRGTSGKLKVRYNNYFGMKEATHLPPMMNGEEFVTLMEDVIVGQEFAAGNLGFRREDVVLSDYISDPELQQNIASGVSTDWIDEISQKGFQMNHTIDLSGGSDNTTYGIGMGYTLDEGAVPGEDFTRYNLRGNLSSDLTDWLNISYSNYVTIAKENAGSYEGFRSAYRLKPILSPYNDDGSRRFDYAPAEAQITNPLFDFDNEIRQTKYLQYIGDIALKISPVEGLSITTKYSPNLKYSRYGEFRGQYTKSSKGDATRTRAYIYNYNDFSYTWDNIVNYEHSFGDAHQLNATLVYSQYLLRQEESKVHSRNLASDSFEFYNIDGGATVNEWSGNFSKQTLQSYTARLNYSILGKYLFTVTGRYDGASILAEGNKWAFFPSAALAWRLGDEAFLQGVSVVSDAKVRMSYGQTGNNGQGGGLGPLASQSFLGNGITNLGDAPVQTAYVTGLANSDLTWERTTELNLGLDYGFLKNRIYGSLDLYNRTIRDIIFYRNLPLVSGFSGTFENIGESTNKGIEFALNAVAVNNGSWKWTTGINFSANRNTLNKLNGEQDEIIFNVGDATLIHRVGESIGAIYDYQYDGIWQLDEAGEAAEYGQYPGQVRVKDIDGDGEITPEDDRTIIGNASPKWNGGITNTINFKNVDFSFFVYTSQGNTAWSKFHAHGSFQHDNNVAALFNSYSVDYWTPEGQSDDWYQPGNPGPFSRSIFYKDVSYFRVGYITLGYTLPQSLLGRVGIGSLRVYATAQNPFTFSEYDGWDPESANRDHYGITFLTRTFITGLNLSF
ncbi:MAG: TonB-dependent receptor [Marinoscillum sp.]